MKKDICNVAFQILKVLLYKYSHLEDCNVWYVHYGGPQNRAGDSKIPWQKAKESLSDVEVEKYYFFLCCSSPDPAIVKKPFCGFSEILLHITYFWFSFLGIDAWNVGLMKSKIVKVKSL